ncbi:polysaccharide pyruvyl transferase family protein [Ancylobacter aquaticus]|nr:polysaccharide pyruvyl transferase family protein [Ancylobacter aquaticus]
MKPTISIISECFSDNLGDQAIARSLSNMLCPYYSISKASFSSLSVVQSNLVLASNQYWKSFLRMIFRTVTSKTKARIRWHVLGEKVTFRMHFRRVIMKSDLVIVGGGQIIKNNIALFCEKLSLISRIAHENSVPFVLIGIGVDKNMNLRNWRIVRNAIFTAKSILLRDNISKRRMCDAFKPKVECAVMPDLAFALTNVELESKATEPVIYLGINVMDINSMLSYRNSIGRRDADTFVATLCDIVKIAHDDGYNICLFTSGSDSDFRATLAVKGDIFAITGIDLPIFHPSSLDDLLSFLVTVNHVIATRMHAGILAYISGCNPLCVNWDDKVEGVWSAINQPERVILLEDILRPSAGAEILMRVQNMTPATRHSLDELAKEVRLGVLENINKALMHTQVAGTLKA